jgi:hypothetical protein
VAAPARAPQQVPQRVSVELDLDAMLPRKTADGGATRRP